MCPLKKWNTVHKKDKELPKSKPFKRPSALKVSITSVFTNAYLGFDNTMQIDTFSLVTGIVFTANKLRMEVLVVVYDKSSRHLLL